MIRAIILTLGVLALVPNFVIAQDSDSLRYITVSGYAETWLQPDAGIWKIAIQALGNDLEDLRKVNDRELARVLSIAEALGVSEREIFTGHLGINQQFERDKYGNNRDFIQFELQRLISIRQIDITRTNEFLDQLLIKGDLNARLVYQVTAIDSVRAELKLKAVLNAKGKAVAMAEALGATVGPPLIISEYPIITDYQEADHLAAQSGVVLRATPEEVHVSEKVYIRFELKVAVNDS